MSSSRKPKRAVRGISQSLCIVFVLFTCGALSEQNQAHRVRNIVLVHGAWADGSGWKGVYDILVKNGYKVSIVQEPETSFQDDVTDVKRILALQVGPSILVGHSYGGAAITKAGTDPWVVGLVYIAAHMPDAGENKADDGKRFPSDLSTSGAIKKTAGGFTIETALAERYGQISGPSGTATQLGLLKCNALAELIPPTSNRHLGTVQFAMIAGLLMLLCAPS